MALQITEEIEVVTLAVSKIGNYKHTMITFRVRGDKGTQVSMIETGIAMYAID
jgi:hypothetical protein